jgi:hypothetical protein
MKVIKLAVPLLALGLIAGCGASSSGGPRSAASIAKAMNCTGLHPSSVVEYYAHAEYDCNFQGHDVSVLIFTSAGSQNGWQTFVDAQGGDYVAGDRWIVEVNDGPEVTSQVQAMTGGSKHLG